MSLEKCKTKKMSLIITRITFIKKLCQSSHLLLRRMLQPEAVATSLHESNVGRWDLRVVYSWPMTPPLSAGGNFVSFLKECVPP